MHPDLLAALVPLAETAGDLAPVWPLPGVQPVQDPPQVCPHTDLAHAGVDLTGAPVGALVVAPEDAVVERADHPWQGDARAMVLRTRTGLLLLLGGLALNSHHQLGLRDGAAVHKGDPLGRLGRLGRLGALHLEVHDAQGRALPSRWWRGEPPPDGLLDPTAYVARMLPRRRPRRAELPAHELLLQWRLLQARRAEYAQLAAQSGVTDAAPSALLRADVKAFIDRLQPTRTAAEAFFQSAPAGWRERMELLLDTGPLVPNLITASSEVRRA